MQKSTWFGLITLLVFLFRIRKLCKIYYHFIHILIK